MKLIKKRVSVEQFSGRKVYLLGRFENGKSFWLEEAKWDCGWYWGFGYIETYNRNNPESSTDIQSHTHYSSLMGKQEYYDHEKGCFRTSTDYVHILNDNPKVAQVTLTEKEQWTLSELMKTFYTLKEASEFFGRGSAHVGNNPLTESLKNVEWGKVINKKLLPEVFQAIYALLTPQELES